MIAPARRLAYHALCRVGLKGVPSDTALGSNAFSALDERDRKLLTEICYGTLRWQLYLDDILARYSSHTWKDVDPRLRILLRLSLYQLRHTDRIPDHAVVNDAVEIAKIELDRAKSSFVNAMLRRVAREMPWEDPETEKDRPPWIRASMPQWLWERWSTRFGRDVAFRYALGLNKPPVCAVWDPNPPVRRGDDPEGEIQSGIVPGAKLLKQAAPRGRYWIQDEASQLMSHLFGSIEGWRIWDACSAPGGKSAILNSYCGGGGLVVSSDYRGRRIRLMRPLLSGFPRSAVLIADAEAPCPFRSRSFDAVLADVPCSGLGTLRRNPEIKWRFQPESFGRLQSRQLSILTSVSDAVRVGGVLLYSTCSTEPEENEQVVTMFLDRHADFRLIRPDSPPGIKSWLDSNGFVRTFPSEHNWDGFFGALILRFS